MTAISWIPSEAIQGLPKLPFELGIGHYDEVPPDRLAGGDLERLHAEDRFREANVLRAWVDAEDGRIVGCGYAGGAFVGSTTFRLGPKAVVVPGVAFETIRSEPERGETSVRFVQTVGGRAGFPAPRRVSGKPFFRIHSATAWTTLALTINADGSSEHELVGASRFPRHWVYDNTGELVQKSGTVDFKSWYRESHGERTPWGDEESDAIVAAAESALERELSRKLMTGGAKLGRKRLKAGEPLFEQGEPGSELYLLLDGVLAVEVEGQPVAELGPGTIAGERSGLEGGTRTATLRARSDCNIAVVPPDAFETTDLEAIAAGRRREE
ncbi:MAG: cyclic nucleotide-binding domain-containing protein [Gaiellaceae bacterium]